ncbi:MAG: YjbQ family protein, partial [Leptolyngbya sp. SIO1D8]|nr:YjbQ family protein [Leptolyngbya sp. SIO1D8]
MAISHQILELPTDDSIGIYDVTAKIQALVDATQIQAGQVLVFS